MELSVVIPAHNEEESIGTVIDSIREEMAIGKITHEIIVVDDGSTDATGGIAEEKGVKLLKNPFNLGYGASLKKGIKEARYDTVLVIDGDGTYSPKSLSGLTQYADSADMVVGARTGKDAHIPLLRRPAKAILNCLANYLTDTKIPDLNSGLRLMKKDIVTRYLNILPDGFSFTTTITLAMATNGHLIKYVPVPYMKRAGRSKIRPVRDTLNFLQLIVRTVLYFNPLKIFLPMSLCLFLASVVLFLYRMFVGRALAVTITILFVTSIQVLAIGMLADLINRKMK